MSLADFYELHGKPLLAYRRRRRRKQK